MEVFFKDAKTFVTKSHSLVLGYELKPSIYDTISYVTIKTPSTLPNEKDFVYIEDYSWIGIVTAVSPEQDRTEISMKQIVTLFDRTLVYTNASFTYGEDYLKLLIDANYTNCSDNFYKLPFLSVDALTHTSTNIRPDIENNLYNIKSYTAKLRRLKGIFCDFSLDRTTLYLDITTKAQVVKNIDFSNPSFKITEQNFSSQIISKITSYCGENSQIQNWTLLDDGSIVNTTPSTGRVDGDWKALYVRDAQDVQNSVYDEFAKNFYSHNITFQCPARYEFKLYDSLQIKIDNKIFTSYVAGLRYWSHSKVIEVQCGELQVKYPYLDLI